MLRRTSLTLLLVAVLLGACSDGDDSSDSLGSQSESQSNPSSIEDLVGSVPGLSEITEPEGTGPLLGTVDGEEVRVADMAMFCEGYGAVATYRDRLAALLETGDGRGAIALIEASVPSAEAGARSAQRSISGGRDLDMIPMSFVVATDDWAYNQLDAETMLERLTARSVELQPFDEAFATC